MSAQLAFSFDTVTSQPAPRVSDHLIRTPSINEIRMHLPGNGGNVGTEPNWTTRADVGYYTWAEIIAIGKSYMIGHDKTDAEYLRTHTSRLTDWQKIAFDWCHLHPTEQLKVEYTGKIWRIYKRGDHVEFELPYHGYGGENAYATRDGLTKVHINND